MKSFAAQHHPLAFAQAVEVLDADAVLSLEKTVRANLAESQQLFIKSRTLEDYRRLVTQSSLKGLYADKKLVATVIFTQHRTESYETDFNQTSQFSAALQEVFDFGILGGLMVHPSYRGRGLASHLVSSILSGPVAQALDCLFAETVAENTYSINCFRQNGFTIKGYEYYAPLGLELCLLQRVPQALPEQLSDAPTLKRA